MTKIFNLMLLSVLLLVPSYSQEKITITGNELRGYEENGERMREVIGEVVLTHGNVVITCDRAIQFIRKNIAQLIGNVIVRQDTLTIKTEEGFYYGTEKIALSNRNIWLDDRKVVLTAAAGEYLFNDSKAVFTNNVRLTDLNSVLTSNKLVYFRKEDKAVAAGKVKIIDSANVIYADSLIYSRRERITNAFNNIQIQNSNDNVYILGNKLFDDRNKNYSRMELNPILIKYDSVSSGIIDTFIIKCKVMESFRDSLERFKAVDSVRLWRGDFASSNDFTLFYRKSERVVTYKLHDSLAQPVIWQANVQLTGDSITVQLSKNSIKKIDVNRSTLTISTNKDFPFRYDQVSGNDFNMQFGKNGLEVTEVYGNVLSYYYMYENFQPKGMIKASSKNAKIYLDSAKVSEVKLYIDPKSEFIPENLVSGKEKTFILPRFILREGKPDKLKLIEGVKIR